MNITAVDVLRATSIVSCFSINTLKSHLKPRDLAYWRFAAWVATRRLCKNKGKPTSYPRIAAIWGNRDHTSIIHGVKRGEADIFIMSRVQRIYDQLTLQVEGFNQILSKRLSIISHLEFSATRPNIRGAATRQQIYTLLELMDKLDVDPESMALGKSQPNVCLTENLANVFITALEKRCELMEAEGNESIG